MTTTFVGLHYVQTRQFAAAKPWLERSLKLKFDTNNVVARNYLTVVDSILAAGAASPAQGSPPRNEQSP
jgi:hypothetical protein